VTEVQATSTSSAEAGPAASGVAADAQRAAGPSGRPMWRLFVPLSALILGADQLTKSWLTSFLAPGESVDVLDDLVRLVHGQNAGGLFGLFQGQALPFALVSVVVVGLIVGYHARSRRNPYLSITLGLLLGGALGNLLDRLRLGYVVDFVDAGIGSVRWYTFNVADAAISFAILLLLAASVWPSVARRTGAEGRG
jgi:signal peptidase II